MAKKRLSNQHILIPPINNITYTVNPLIYSHYYSGVFLENSICILLDKIPPFFRNGIKEECYLMFHESEKDYLYIRHIRSDMYECENFSEFIRIMSKILFKD